MYVVHNALSRPFKPVGVEPARVECRKLGVKTDCPYILHVGGNDWYKNRPGVLRIFKHLLNEPGFSQYHLLMVGKPWTDEMRACVGDAGINAQVHEVVGATSDQLEALYSGAEALLFPSLAEGFGWPIVEAQACGCPVVTSGRPPMCEVGGDAAVYIDPADEKAAARRMAEALKDPRELRVRGYENVRRFSRERMLAGYLEIYESVVASG